MAAVDVVITNYNRSAMVQNAILSVLKQTFTDFMLYVVDDGSTDDSLKVIHSMCDRDPRCCVIESAHIGLNGSVKDMGASHGTSPYLTFVDSDDTIAINALDEVMKAFQEHPVDIIYTDQIVVDGKGGKKVAANFKIPYSAEKMLSMRLIKQLTVMKREVHQRLSGHDPAFTYAADYDFFVKASEFASVYHLEKPLYFYFVDPDHDQISVKNKEAQTMFAYRARRAGYLRRSLPVPDEVEKGSKLGQELG